MTEAHQHYFVLVTPTDGGPIVGHCACGEDCEKPATLPLVGRGHRDSTLRFPRNLPDRPTVPGYRIRTRG